MNDKKQRILMALGCLLAGSLITLSLSPFDIWPLAIVSVAVFHWLLQNATPKQAMWRSLGYAAGIYLSGTYWLYVSIHYHGNASPALASIMTIGFNLFMASMFMPFAYLYARWIRGTLFGNTLGFTAIWVLCEAFRSWVLTGFPWMLIGYSQLDSLLASWAPVIGILGISFILAFTAACLSSAAQNKQIKPVLLAAVFWIVALPLSSINWTQAKSDAINIAMIQANVPQEDKWDPRHKDAILNHYKNTTMTLGDSDIIFWPETSIPNFYHNSEAYLQSITDFATSTDTAVILGIPSLWQKDNKRLIHNTVLGIGKADGIYHKQKLVPFGEYVPLEDILRGLIDFFDLPMSAFTKGPENQEPLTAFGYTFMPYICYEIVYHDFVASTGGNADILLTLSNDTWFGESIGPLQHMQMARMRALELGRYLIRSTNNGVTAIVNPKGQVTHSLPQFTQDVLKSQVYAYEGLTPMARYGTLPTLILSLILAVLMLAQSIRKQRP